jgi:hypothetical protein
MQFPVALLIHRRGRQNFLVDELEKKMQVRLRTYSGLIVVLTGLPAWGQTGSQTAAASVPASAPDGSNGTKVNDPTWFVAGLVTGLVIGAIGARVFGGSKSSTR